MSVIYTPKGKAREYCELALNIYTGCTNGCSYCYAPIMLHRSRENFQNKVEPRKDIVERVKQDISKSGGAYAGKTVQLCFTCDPYPFGVDTTPTREIIKLLKESGANVQVLTKNGMKATRDFDLLDSADSFGVTLTLFSTIESDCFEPRAQSPSARVSALKIAKQRSLKTWVSFEPVIKPTDTLALLNIVIADKLADVVKVGKLNYTAPPVPVDWKAFGKAFEERCRAAGQRYYIKNSLRAEMEKE